MRDKSGLTQVELAEKIGSTQAVISFWEIGRNLPEASKLPALAKALGCTVNDLFCEEEVNDEEPEKAVPGQCD